MKITKLSLVMVGTCLIALIVSLPLILSCAEQATTPAPASAPEEELPKLEIKIHGINAARPPFDISYTWPKKWFEGATNGRAEVTIYDSNSICTRKESYECIINGVADATWLFVPLIPSVLPLSEVVHLPGLFSEGMAVNNRVMGELIERYPQFIEQFDPQVVHLSTQVHMGAHIHSFKPVRTVDDLKGKVIGAQSKALAQALELLGASPTVMSSGDMYTAGERGVVDGVANAWGAFRQFSLYEVFDYHTLISVSPAVSHWIMNRDTWNKLTPQEQWTLKELEPAFQNSMNVGSVRDVMVLLSEEVTPEKGHELIEWSMEDMNELRETFRPIWNEWAEDMEAKGYPGYDILDDCLRFIEYYSKL